MCGLFLQVVELSDVAQVRDHQNDFILIVKDWTACDKRPFSGLKFLLDRDRPLLIHRHQRSGSGDRSIFYKLPHVDA